MSAESELVDQVLELADLGPYGSVDLRNLLAGYRETVWQNGYRQGKLDAEWQW